MKIIVRLVVSKGTFAYNDPNLIFVLGKNEKGQMSPYKKDQIEKIKEQARLQSLVNPINQPNAEVNDLDTFSDVD